MPKMSARSKRLADHMTASPMKVTVEPTTPAKTRPSDLPPEPASETAVWLALGHEDLRDTFSKALMRIDIVDGRLACTGIHLETRGELAGTDLRAFPVAAMTPLVGYMAQSMNGQLKEVKPSTAKPAGRKGYDPAHYDAVAEMYRQALVVAPGRPIGWMTDQYDEREDPPSEDTVRRWVRHIRKNLPHLLEEPS